MHTDPIADMLTRIRNASMAKLEETQIPYSKVKEKLAEVMKLNNYISDIEIVGEGIKKMLVVKLPQDKSINLKRLSKPGQRIYRKAKELYPFKRGYGIRIITTCQGVMTEKEAMNKKLGGELICEIY